MVKKYYFFLILSFIASLAMEPSEKTSPSTPRSAKSSFSSFPSLSSYFLEGVIPELETLNMDELQLLERLISSNHPQSPNVKKIQSLIKQKETPESRKMPLVDTLRTQIDELQEKASKTTDQKEKEELLQVIKILRRNVDDLVRSRKLADAIIADIEDMRRSDRKEEICEQPQALPPAAKPKKRSRSNEPPKPYLNLQNIRTQSKENNGSQKSLRSPRNFVRQIITPKSS